MKLIAATFLLFLLFEKVVSLGLGWSNFCPQTNVDVVKSPCTKCSTARTGRSCPQGYVRFSGVKRGCRYDPRNRRGCYAKCKKTIHTPKCCENYWGRQCFECPTDFQSRVCSGHGSCDWGLEASGNCTCQQGVHGDTCNECINKNAYGDNCINECTCVHGKCNSGIFRDGSCLCYSGYKGPNCDISNPACGNITCGEHERCVVSSTSTHSCECDIGFYRNSTSSTCDELHSCDASGTNTCHKMAQCANVGPAQYVCQCLDAYEGDGFYCHPVDKCRTNNGGCANGTLCVFAGANQVNCTCRDGYELVNGTCNMKELCGTKPRYTCLGANTCTTVDYQVYVDVKCECTDGGRLEGRTCYSGMLSELQKVLSSARWNITKAANLSGGYRSQPKAFALMYVWDHLILTDSIHRFTLLMPTDEALSKIDTTGWSVEKQIVFARAHILPAEVILDFVDGTAQTMSSLLGYNTSGKALKPLNIGGKISPYTAIIKWKQGSSCNVISPIQYAKEGVYYVIDGVNMPSDEEFNMLLNTTTGELRDDVIMSQLPGVGLFRQLFARYWKGLNPWFGHQDHISTYFGTTYKTLFIPTDKAVRAVIDDEELDYLRTPEGRDRLGAIIRSHMVEEMVKPDNFDWINFYLYHFDVFNFINLKSIQTYGNEGDFPVTVSSHDGSIQISEQHARLLSAIWSGGPKHNRNFIIVDRVIFPHYFDTIEKRICPRHVGKTKDICAPCHEENPCPNHHKLLQKHKEQCLVRHEEHRDLYKGLVKYPEYGCRFTCADNITTHECCPGFYGSLCQRCPGPSGNPCYGQGICLDGSSGNGQCSCGVGTTGVDCRTCVNANKFGNKCISNCTCAHGICDNHVDANNGVCNTDTCEYMPTSHHNTTNTTTTMSPPSPRTNWLGVNCDQPSRTCQAGPLSKVCHHNAVCVQSIRNNTNECNCLAGYRGDGIQSCVAYDVCADVEESGCHALATCNVSTTGAPQCTCSPGYAGDGKSCLEVGPCDNGGGCHAHAKCDVTTRFTHRCSCASGYRGNGYICQQVSPCEDGTCGEFGTCALDGEGIVNCTCQSGYFKQARSTGSMCFATIQARLIDDVSLSQIRGFYEDPEQDGFRQLIHEIDESNSLQTSAYLFPNDGAWSKMGVDDYRFWTTPQHLPYLFQYVITRTDQAYDFLISMKSFPAALVTNRFLISKLKREHIPLYNDSPTNFTYGAGSDQIVHYLPQIGKVRASVESYLQLANHNFLFVIDRVLVPTRDLVQDFPSITSVMNSNETDSRLSKYRLFLRTLENDGVMSSITNLSHYTIFALPDDDFDPTKYNQLELRYNVIPSIIRSSDAVNGKYYQTIAPDGYQVELTISEKTMYINQMAVVDADMRTERGVVHGLRYDLPELHKNRCSAQQTGYLKSKCQNCRDRTCRSWDQLGIGRVITRRPLNSQTQRSCSYRDRRGRFKADGCSVLCMYRNPLPEPCCANYYGRQCEPCPGGITTTCSGKGTCFDGRYGNGTCSCAGEKYTGLACDECATGLYGATCDVKCNCTENGVCVDGIHGTGACICKQGFMGSRCEQVYDDASDHCDGRCHTAALCLTHPSTLYTCECMSGYAGNGSNCEPVNPCKSSSAHNCHELATCMYQSPGMYQCKCKPDYEGDGTFCEGINPCNKNNSDTYCTDRSSCHHTGPNKYECVCNEGYEKIPTHVPTCTQIDPCKLDNGGCHEFAHCFNAGPNMRTCKCLHMLQGDGITCMGSVIFEFVLLGRSLHGSKFFNKVDLTFIRRLSTMVHDFVGLKGELTMFVPDQFNLLSKMPSANRKTMDNHFVTCDAIYNEDDGLLKSQVRTLGGEVLQLQSINKTSFLINGTITAHTPHRANNGWIFLTDRDFDSLSYFNDTTTLTSLDNITDLLTQLGAGKFAQLMKMSGSLELLKNPIHNNKWTLLVPSDAAMAKLPENKKRQLQREKDVLTENIRYHMIASFSEKMVEYSVHPYTLTTEQGSDVTIACGKHAITGTISINEGEADVTNFQRVIIELPSAIPSDTISLLHKSTIMIIDSMLEPPSIGGRCDEPIYENVTESCSICFSGVVGINSCDQGMKVGEEHCEDPANAVFKIQGNAHGLYECAMICTHYNVSKKCCDDHYSASCLPCPGGAGNSCFGNGVCDSGINGTGQCTCNEGFAGLACEFCAVARFGINCQPCNCTLHGSCNDGVNGDGKCFCDEGYIGADCSIAVAHPATCGNNCSVNGVCSALSKACICRPGYTGDGIDCIAINKCLTHNPCSYHADCLPQGVNVTCKCKTGFIGDGFECRELAVGCQFGYPICHPQASCAAPSGGGSEHVCTCNDGFVGDGVADCKSTHEMWLCSKTCSAHADCHVINGAANCTCQPGFIGNGKVCFGDVSHVILQHPKWQVFMNWVYENRKDVLQIFQGQQNITVFIPLQNGQSIKTDNVEWYIIPGQKLTMSDLRRSGDKVYKSYKGHDIKVQVATDGTIHVNGIVVEEKDYVATNGIIHPVDGIIPQLYDNTQTVRPTTQTTTTTQPTTTTTKQTTTKAKTETPTTTTTTRRQQHTTTIKQHQQTTRKSSILYTTTSSLLVENPPMQVDTSSPGSKVAIVVCIIIIIGVMIGVAYWKVQKRRNNFTMLQESGGGQSNPIYDSTAFVDSDHLQMEEFGLMGESES